MKTCTKCGKEKDVAEFHKYKHVCKKCKNAMYRRNHKLIEKNNAHLCSICSATLNQEEMSIKGRKCNNCRPQKIKRVEDKPMIQPRNPLFFNQIFGGIVGNRLLREGIYF